MATSTSLRQRKKVLIVYATGGMGHVKAAKAIAEAISVKYQDVEVRNIDVIDYATKLYRKVFVDGYNYVSAKKPELWGWLYRGFNKESRQKLPTILSQLAIESNFIPVVKEFNPDFIISTHPLPMRLISASKRKEIIDIISSMVVTDFGCHSFWVDSEVDYYFVATEEVKQGIKGYNVSDDKIIVTGIPIELKFSQQLDKKSLIEKFGLIPNLFTLLIVGGQFDFIALQEIINGIKNKNTKVQFMVVAGRDKELKQALEKSAFQKDPNVKIFGFIDNMEELMTVSDLIFSKAGGLTVSECLAKGLPMIFNKVIPGQEEDNVNYLVSRGAAVKAKSNLEIVGKVNDLINQPEEILVMRQSCEKIGRPKSAEAVSDFIYQTINQ